MTTAPILVTGGTGKTGRRVAARLRHLGVATRVASRSSGDVRFDWADEATWGPALSGVGAVYLVDSQTATAAEEMRAFVARAQASGVRRLVLLSARVWGELGDEAWLATENAVRESTVEWTVLRPTWFAQNFGEEALLVDALNQGELRLPTGEGREPFIDAEDIAEVAVAALTGDGHAGMTYELSGPRAMTWGEAVAEIAGATGRDLRFTAVSDEQYHEEITGRGWPAEAAAVTGLMFAHIREGHSEALSDGVQRVLGREPVDFTAYARRLASADS
ncbi:Uncharacterized conserved protein YbjT, contains NAD(P)-binding and DUF2867 domains [Streptoalloteichus tenebrarius]|uniref:Uncharacterized conserved protein YbjT, contains NAD(P)-binding and DUF2867 domains n=1 Tax=Streptoalloteichus tenebrarius (strain ATCC 17920 / DSM 40477 / JCM 4838 / CBS 697.72 / NBRC 16177 / NCIMB 11028 / NRRL B-12390 / A12253. 1 / ISP 5477) TaxID=1933 RepID=A0ABT1HWD7_STRSD|nr:NAD(P)H-binding protein [Streptoalloteichus tenebrarius]MCP2259826.1 Uncharacterized conserved protein YbjT, contains NAD(P)-binding and DUF2867 domains [Streptoalloteichus tenebrarius]BFE99224.1 NAD(P)H-binding protein [Streptoalloteichus tenebrarius]